MTKKAQNDTDTKAPDIEQKDTLPPVLTLCRPVRSAKAARKYLARLLSAFQRGEVDATNARTSVYLLSEYLRSIEVSENEGRIRAIEHLINQNAKRRK